MAGGGGGGGKVSVTVPVTVMGLRDRIHDLIPFACVVGVFGDCFAAGVSGTITSSNRSWPTAWRVKATGFPPRGVHVSLIRLLGSGERERCSHDVEC